MVQTLVVFLPALNEEEKIKAVVRSIPRKIDGVQSVEILVVDDGSTDKTVVQAKDGGAIVVSHSVNRGVGAAFQTGVERALELGADILVNIDADGQFNPRDIPTLIKPILDDTADFVASDRFTKEDGTQRCPEYMSRVKYWGNRQIARLISILSGQTFRDVSSGFRAYSRKALLMLNLTGDFTYTQEVFLDLAVKGLRITAVPTTVIYFPERTSRVAKSVVRYAFRTLKIILRTFRDYKPMVFFLGVSTVPFLVGIIMEVFMVAFYISYRTISPYKAVGFIGLYLLSFAFVFWIIGLLADMFVRIRINQERQLYILKRMKYEK